MYTELGSLMRKSLTARFCRTLGTLLSSGVALVDALSILTKASGNQYVERTLTDVLGRVRRGSSLYQPLKQAGFFPDMVVQMIAVGEQTAELDGMLLHAAEHYEQEVDAFLDGLMSIIEPILIVDTRWTSFLDNLAKQPNYRSRDASELFFFGIADFYFGSRARPGHRALAE